MSFEGKKRKYNIDFSGPYMAVGVDDVKIATDIYTFETEKIGPCSGYTFLSESRSAAGLYHVSPNPIIDQYADELEVFSGGICQPIHSGKSRKKEAFEQFLIKNFNIYILPAIALLSENSIDILFTPTLHKIAVLGNDSKNISHYNFN